MATRGLLAGFGDAELAAAPLAAAGAGFNRAVVTGLKAYGDEFSRQHEEGLMALRAREGERSEKRLSMAEQLLPGQLTSQELANRAQRQTIDAAGNRATREEAQRAKTAALLDDVKAGKITDPIEFNVRVGDAVIAGGDPNHVSKWLGDHEGLLKTGKAAEENRGLLANYMGAVKEQASSPKDPMVWGRTVDKMLKENPLAAANSPFFKAAMDHMNKSVDAEFPGPVAEGWKEYVGMRAGNPALSPAQAWSQVQSKMDPSFHAKFNSLMPPDVKLEYGAMAKGAEEKAGAEAKLPSELKKIEATGAAQRALEKEKEKGREARALRPSKDQEKLLADATRRLGQIEQRLKDPFLSAEGRAGLEADRTAAIQERREYQENLVLARDREGKEMGEETGILDPKKVRAEAIGPFTTQLRQKSKSLDNSKAALDLSLKNGKISQAEYDQLLAAETKRWGTKK